MASNACAPASARDLASSGNRSSYQVMSADFFVAVAIGTKPVQLPTGTALLTAAPLEQYGP
jgi:hypothetical protein